MHHCTAEEWGGGKKDETHSLPVKGTYLTRTHTAVAERFRPQTILLRRAYDRCTTCCDQYGEKTSESGAGTSHAVSFKQCNRFQRSGTDAAGYKSPSKTRTSYIGHRPHRSCFHTHRKTQTRTHTELRHHSPGIFADKPTVCRSTRESPCVGSSCILKTLFFSQPSPPFSKLQNYRNFLKRLETHGTDLGAPLRFAFSLFSSCPASGERARDTTRGTTRDTLRRELHLTYNSSVTQQNTRVRIAGAARREAPIGGHRARRTSKAVSVIAHPLFGFGRQFRPHYNDI